MTTFVTGCTHFGHSNIIGFAQRPFISADEMDVAMLDRWNSVVKPNDTVVHLGDVYWWKNDYPPVLNRANGKKVYVRGNHDPKHFGDRDYLELSYAGHKFVLFHYPIEDWNGAYRGTIHLHSHTHSKQKFSMAGEKCRIHVGVDAWNFTPVSLDDIIKLARGDE